MCTRTAWFRHGMSRPYRIPDSFFFVVPVPNPQRHWSRIGRSASARPPMGALGIIRYTSLMHGVMSKGAPRQARRIPEGFSRPSRFAQTSQEQGGRRSWPSKLSGSSEPQKKEDGRAGFEIRSEEPRAGRRTALQFSSSSRFRVNHPENKKGEKTMADFVQNTNVKSSVRKLAAPIADIDAFSTIVQNIILNNPFGCVSYMSGGVNHPPVEKTREAYTARIVYQDALAKTVGRASRDLRHDRRVRPRHHGGARQYGQHHGTRWHRGAGPRIGQLTRQP